MNKNRVLLGLSGGVDSTTAALLLKEKGFSVTGYYFDVTGKNTEGLKEAKKTAEQLGIDLITEDVSKAFENTVISNFCSEYIKGRTPNPCVVCNPAVKFKKLTEQADKIGAYYIATGHYCRIDYDSAEDIYYVKKAANEKKDQSYMLYRLKQEVLKRAIFPLGDFCDKADIRELARKSNMPNSEKKDSQEICFVSPDTDYAEYIQSRGFYSAPGNFVDRDGKVLGNHRGIVNYTVGQRKGLGIALGRPVFITEIDKDRNEIVLGSNEDLFTKKVLCKDFVFAGNDSSKYDNRTVYAKIRYSSKPAKAVIQIEEDMVAAVFEQPQRAAAPGQSMVFYEGERLIGGGYIL